MPRKLTREQLDQYNQGKLDTSTVQGERLQPTASQKPLPTALPTEQNAPQMQQSEPAQPKGLFSKEETGYLNELGKTKQGQTVAYKLIQERLSPSNVIKNQINQQKYQYNQDYQPLKLQQLQGNYDYSQQANPYKLNNLQYQGFYNTQVRPQIDQANIAKSYGAINNYGSNNGQNQNYQPVQAPQLPVYQANPNLQFSYDNLSDDELDAQLAKLGY